MSSLISIQYVAPQQQQVYDGRHLANGVMKTTEPQSYKLNSNNNNKRSYSSYSNNNNNTNSGHSRLAYVDALVDANAVVIESIWKLNTSTTSNKAVVPLRTFIQEVLKRSRTTYSTLQTALFYLFRSRPCITEYLEKNSSSSNWQDAYISCGRRMFLASLVVASKFVQDKTYRNSAWAKIAGLPVNEINAAERIFLNLIDYRLYISQPIFEKWHHLLHLHVESKTTGFYYHDLLNTNNFSFAPIDISSSNNSWIITTNYIDASGITSRSSSSSSSSSSNSSSKKRKYNKSAAVPPPLSMSVPSSINSSPMQTPIQISPVRVNNILNSTSPSSFITSKKRKYTGTIPSPKQQQQQQQHFHTISHVRQRYHHHHYYQ